MLSPTTILALGAAFQAAPPPPTLAAHFAAVHERAVALLEANPRLEHNPTAVFVRFRPAASESYRDEVRHLVGTGVLRRYRLVPDLELVDCQVPIEQALAILAPHVLYAEPDHVLRLANSPDDAMLGQLWGLHNVGQPYHNQTGIPGADVRARDAWAVFTGDPDFVVAILDTGVLYTHPDLAANAWANPGEVAGNGLDDDANGYVDDVRGYDFYDYDSDPKDEHGHGTHVSGTIGAVGDNQIGVAGLNWRCKLMALRFIGPYGGYESDAAAAIEYMAQKGVRVSNNSYGGPDFSQVMYDEISAARGVGHVFCVAAGNDGTSNDSTPFYPAAYDLDNLIAVAATDNRDARASFSNWGLVSVDIAAPGVGIQSTYLGNSYAAFQGTSMACPHVAGVAALVTAQNPSWTYAQVRGRLLSTARPVAAFAGLVASGGVVDAGAAIVGSAANEAPVVIVSSPLASAYFQAGDLVQFSATASDPEDGDLTASIRWRSSLDGDLGLGSSFSLYSLSVGVHAISAVVEDSGGFGGNGGVRVTVTWSGTPPAPPDTPVVKNLGGLQARVTWLDNSTNEYLFDVQRERKSDLGWVDTQIVGTLGPNQSLFVDSVPAPGGYRYRVRSVGSHGTWGWTSWRSRRITD